MPNSTINPILLFQFQKKLEDLYLHAHSKMYLRGRHKLFRDKTTNSHRLVKSGKPLGAIVINRIVKKPTYALKISTAARKAYNESMQILSQMEKAAERKAPIEELKSLYFSFFTKSREAQLNRAFDFKTYQTTLRKCLKKEYADRREAQIIKLVAPPSGVNADSLLIKMNILSHLAHEYGRKINDPGVYAFNACTWDWLVKNYTEDRYSRSKILTTSEEQIRATVDKFIKTEKITANDYYGIIERLREINRVAFIYAREWARCKKEVLKATKPEYKKTAMALIDFAGEMSQLTEESNIPRKKAFRIIVDSAKKQGMTIDQLLKFLNS